MRLALNLVTFLSSALKARLFIIGKHPPFVLAAFLTQVLGEFGEACLGSTMNLAQ